MSPESRGADAARAMTTVLEQQQRAGRFGRESRAEEVTDEGTAHFGYVVDPDAVAEAIIARLLAGRTLPRKRYA